MVCMSESKSTMKCVQLRASIFMPPRIHQLDRILARLVSWRTTMKPTFSVTHRNGNASFFVKLSSYTIQCWIQLSWKHGYRYTLWNYPWQWTSSRNSELVKYYLLPEQFYRQASVLALWIRAIYWAKVTLSINMWISADFNPETVPWPTTRQWLFTMGTWKTLTRSLLGT